MMLEYEPIIRLSAFGGVLAIMALLEAMFPRRQRRFGRLVRWPGNFMIMLLNTLLVRLLFPAAAVGFALLIAEQQTGVLNVIAAPFPIAVIASMLILDLAIYLQHIVFHRVPWLWRIHRMHHTDLDLDVTSGARFHPLEIILSMLIKLAVIWLTGAPATAVLLFEVLLNAGAMFNHANLRLPIGVDRALRLLIVTPDMHRIHHSVLRDETDSNFGFNLSWWDRIFGTYIIEPQSGQKDMTLGLPDMQSINVERIDEMLRLPFERQTSN
jgi:sterol desaturase/sphingolipid hydroxylase (fatty acid hydroxylase superfamily)